MSDTSQPLDEFDEIRLSRTVVRVPWDKRKELAERLDAAGLSEAADDLRSRRTFTATDKPAVLGVLNAWLDEAKVGEFGEELMDLRHEIDLDITERR